MIRIQEIKRKNHFGTEYRSWIPTDTQELSIAFEKSPPGTSAVTDTDHVMTREVDDKYLFNVRGNGTMITQVSKVDN